MAGPYFEDLFTSVGVTTGINLRKPIGLGVTGAAVQILAGVGAPGTAGTPSATAPANSLYMRVDGNSTTTRMYVATAVGTWTTVTTAA